MAKLSYAEQLLQPEWFALRQKVLERENSTCQVCGATEKTLNAHHKKYIRGRLAWEYHMSNFLLLCEDCHADAHDLQDGELHFSKDGPMFHYFVRELENGLWLVYYKTLGSNKRTTVYECPNKTLAFEARDKLKRQACRKHKEETPENIYRIRGY